MGALTSQKHSMKLYKFQLHLDLPQVCSDSFFDIQLNLENENRNTDKRKEN